MRQLSRRLAVLLGGAIVATACPALAQTALTYQGRLEANGQAATGSHDLRLRLFDSALAGNQLGPTLCVDNVSVSDGLFVATLDFGAQFSGSTRWLQIEVRQDATVGNCNAGAFTLLNPRQGITVAPQASFATKVGRPDASALEIAIDARRAGVLTPAQTAGPTGYRSHSVVFGASSNNVGAGVIGATIGGGGSDGIGNANLPNTASANFATIAGGEFNNVTSAHATIGGGFGNFVDLNSPHATIGGGDVNIARWGGATIAGGTSNQAIERHAFVGGGESNAASGQFSTISGGTNNQASGIYSTIGGGVSNVSSNQDSTVAGGRDNEATNTSTAVGGGQSNTASGQLATVAGGTGNRATQYGTTVGGGSTNMATDEYATVAGGRVNEASGRAATVGGGSGNGAFGSYSAVGGGETNQAGGDYAMVPGGRNNSANAGLSFAAGDGATALHTGSFVWADSLAPGAASPRANTFIVNAAGGTGITNGLAVLGASSPYWSGANGVFIERGANAQGQPIGLVFAYQYPGTARSLCLNSPGGNVGIGLTNPAPQYLLHVNGLVAGIGAFVNLSDARLKTNVAPIRGGDALARVSALRGVTYVWDQDASKGLEWNLPEGRQLGLIAQEVERVVPEAVTTDDQGYKSVAYDTLTPLLIEAVKAQQRRIEELEARLARLEALAGK
jgi:hypothetical protein